MNLYEGIYLRRSIRNYRMEKIEDKVLANILNFTDHLEMMNEEQQVRFEIIENVKTKVDGKNIPYYLVLSAYKTEGYQLNAGFLMEQVMLYLMTKGLGSCFMRYHNLAVHEIEGFEPVIMLAFGNTDKNIYREEKKAKRLPLKDMCSFKTAVSDDIKKILNASRLAPSSLNSQPWCFVAYDNRIHLFCKKSKIPFEPMKKLQYIDVGIALANMYLVAEELWYSSEIVKMDNIKEHSFKNNEYLVSIILQS
ncbi:MAG: nitroreductase family protein [Acetivibrio sp.]